MQYFHAMRHEGFMIRPPSEADSILLQATLGCSHNRCIFCGAYLAKPFKVKDEATVFADIDWAAEYCRAQRRLFLCDGDALVMPQHRLERILERIAERLPWVTRVSTYAGAAGLARKSGAELRRLRKLNLTVIYMGLESGDDGVLQRMHKEALSGEMVRQARRAKDAGLKLNVTVLLGLAGPEGSLKHAQATGQVLSRMGPEQIAALTLMLVPGTQLHAEAKAGRFRLPDAQSMLAELRELLASIDVDRGLFLCNHASNYLPMRLRLPRDKDKGLAAINAALRGEARLREETARRL